MITAVIAIILLSLVGSVILIGICGPLAGGFSALPPRFNPTAAPYHIRVQLPDLPADRYGGFDFGDAGEIHNEARQWILEESIRVLRNQGKSDEEIREILLRSFSVSEEDLDQLLGVHPTESL